MFDLSSLKRGFPDIGQLTKEDIKGLDKMVRQGKVVKWRDCWIPTMGFGPLKTWYKLTEE